VSALATALLAVVLPAVGVAGRWEGTVALGDADWPVAVDLAPTGDGGGWVGSMVVSGLGVKGAPLSEIAVALPRVSFALAGPRGGQGLDAKAELQLRAPGELSGVLSHAGRSSPLLLRRTGDAQVDLPLASTSVEAAALGEWHGEYELFDYPRKVTLSLENGDGAARASFVIEGKRHNDLPVDLVRQEGETLFIVSSATGIRFEGRLSADRAEIAGAVLQGPIETPLVLHRAPRGPAS
jgi:hypothetical protein